MFTPDQLVEGRIGLRKMIEKTNPINHIPLLQIDKYVKGKTLLGIEFAGNAGICPVYTVSSIGDKYEVYSFKDNTTIYTDSIVSLPQNIDMWISQENNIDINNIEFYFTTGEVSVNVMKKIINVKFYKPIRYGQAITEALNNELVVSNKKFIFSMYRPDNENIKILMESDRNDSSSNELRNIKLHTMEYPDQNDEWYVCKSSALTKGSRFDDLMEFVCILKSFSDCDTIYSR